MEGPITGVLFVDWALMAVSLFDVILLLWLALTVLLNSDRRSWAVWMAGIGLILGSAFFVCHAALLGEGLQELTREMNVWWHLAWPPVLAAPLAWYVAMLWYSGFWEDRQATLHTRQLPWLYLTVAVLLALICLLVFANPLPSYQQVWELHLIATPTLGGIPLLIVLYSVYIVMCLALSLEALLRPGPSGRMMGDLARRRARPWLVSASLTLLLVSLLVAWVLTWIVRELRAPGLFADISYVVIGFDLAIAFFIAVSVVLLGQAIVSYEVFTGKVLPRHGLRSQWLSALILASGFGLVAGLGFALQLRPVYGILLATVLMTLFYAL